MSLNLVKWKITKKQRIALNYLRDKQTTEILFGGGAGGAKSFLGCSWIAMNCIQYPGSRWVIGRARLTHLKSSTLLTFFDVLKRFNLRADKDYRYNVQEAVIRFYNGSEVYLRELQLDPSDPEFDKLGSTEYTGAFIDECSQVSTKGKNILMSRLRYKLEEFDLIPKLLMCSNPTKNFLYTDFYKPSKNKTLEPYRAFVPALATDNPFISPHYIANLKKMDKNSRERLLYGNWEYDDDPSRLFDFDSICDMFRKSREKNPERYLIGDIARFGKDRTVLFLWEGLYMYRAIVLTKFSTKEIRQVIERLCKEEYIKRSNCLVDEDGVGGGVVDETDGIKGFVNNSSPINPRDKENCNYRNLKSQCYFLLADMIHAGKIGMSLNDDLKEGLIEELEQIKRKNADADGKLEVIGKDEIKEYLGRSPDLADCLMMRMYFELQPKFEYHFF